MTPAQIVLAGGAGVDFAAKCAKVYAEFDPPIVTGSYSAVSRARQEANAEARNAGTKSGFENQQSEHMCPNCNLQSSRGDSSTNIGGASGYTEGGGFTYNVYDDQSQGTEHRWLTDAECHFADTIAARDKPASIGEWIDHMGDQAAEMLDSDDLVRDTGGEKRTRIKDAKNKTPEERKKLAQDAAECLKMEAKQQFANQKVKEDTSTRNGLAGKRKRDALKSGGGKGGTC
jgi:hypothetical protein